MGAVSQQEVAERAAQKASGSGSATWTYPKELTAPLFYFMGNGGHYSNGGGAADMETLKQQVVRATCAADVHRALSTASFAPRCGVHGAPWPEPWRTGEATGCRPRTGGAAAAAAAAAAAGARRPAGCSQLVQQALSPALLAPCPLPAPAAPSRAAAFTSLIQYLAKCRQPDTAVAVFEAMAGVAGVHPNTFTFSALNSALGRAGRWQQAEAYFLDLLHRAKADPSCAPNTVTFAALISGAGRGGAGRRERAGRRARGPLGSWGAAGPGGRLEGVWRLSRRPGGLGGRSCCRLRTRLQLPLTLNDPCPLSPAPCPPPAPSAPRLPGPLQRTRRAGSWARRWPPSSSSSTWTSSPTSSPSPHSSPRASAQVRCAGRRGVGALGGAPWAGRRSWTPGRGVPRRDTGGVPGA